MIKETKLQLKIPFDEALKRFASVNIKDIIEIEPEINGKSLHLLLNGTVVKDF